jgi:TRAP-type C4-dicarboxylate transport system permease small subunit
MTKPGRIYDAVITGLACIAGALMVMIFVFIMMDVVLRNMLISPPAWSSPMAEYALLYITMFSAPWLVRTRGHVLLEVLRQSLSPRRARMLEIGVYVICIAICVVMSGFAIERLLWAISSGEEDFRAIDIPRAWLFAPAAIAFPLIGTEFLRFLLGHGSLYDSGPDDNEGM